MPADEVNLPQNLLTGLLQLAQAFEQFHIRYALIGGVASGFRSRPRFTHDLDFLVDLHNGMAAGLTDAELEAQFATNARLLEQLAGQLVSTVIEACTDQSKQEATRNQIQRWMKRYAIDPDAYRR